ncbi:hypothetical protein [Sphingomonas sp. OK281]|uniref:hypothetical protein n=1 Tax=Sphingomonas sp. OK281 TaxID=1881067 RepID=UPI0008F25545|nr:hypothetical protein [Sphingomonas sp. OK281]SFO08212.1 hypothetical protein SAMN05428984_2129 [Sphingomonas sp. OK281]
MLTNPAIRRYNRRVMLLSLVYAALLFATIYLFVHGALHGPIAYVAALLPALPLIGIFLVLGRYIVEETDEYLRMLMIRQSLVASGFMLSIMTGWGFLEGFGLVPHIPAYYAAVLWFAGLWIGWGYNIATMRRGA